MKLFGRKEKRNDSGAAGFSDGLLSALIGGVCTVTKAEALQIPTVAACVNVIAGKISALPVKLYRQSENDVEEITGDSRLRLLNHSTGDTVNATELKKLWVRDYFLGKGSYTYIARNLFNEITGIFYVDEQRVSVIANNDPIRKSYAVNVGGRTYFPFEFLKILRNSKGLGTGTSLIAEDPLILAVYYNTMKFENANIRKGGNKRGFLKAQNKLSQPAMEELRAAWRRLYSNSDEKEDIVLLNGGVDFKESSSTSVELQLNENKQTNAAEICKLFCMPLDILNGKASEATMSQFVQNCLMPLINTIESALDNDLLTEAEKNGGYYFAFDTSELTRGDFASRMNGYATALQNNIYQLDEIREKEDLPPLGFNYIRLGLDTVLIDPATGQIYTPNTDKTAVMDANLSLTEEEKRSIIEARGRHYIKGEHGYFMGSVSDGQSGGSSTVSSNGFSSGIANEFAESTFEKTGHIDVSDKKQVEEAISDFEKRYEKSELEHCIVITENGDVYEVHGGRYTVDPTVIGAENMRESINEHNHVAGLSQYSFSKEDIYESCKDGSYMSMAFDEKYKYSMTFKNKVPYEKVHDVYVDSEISLMSRKALGEKIKSEDEQHEVVKLTCEALGIKYERWLR